MSTQRGRIRITGFDTSRVEQRDDLSGWTPTETAKAEGRWQRAFRRFRHNGAAMVGLGVVAAMVLIAVFARPVEIAGVTVQPIALAPYDPFTRVTFQGSSAGIYAPPSLQHPFGTGRNGRDVLSRVMYGGRLSISIGFIVVAITATIGLAYGAIAGYYGGWVDEIMMRFVDTIYAFPGLLLALVVVAVLGRGYWQLVAAFVIPGWAGYARLIRGEVLKAKENEYVTAARALGARDRSVIFKHVVPNSIAPLIVQASLAIGTVVIGVAALGFLGLGFERAPEWGTMLNGARETVIPGPGGSVEWWATIFPGGAIFLFVMAMNMVGDGVNDALDAQEVGNVGQGPGGGG